MSNSNEKIIQSASQKTELLFRNPNSRPTEQELAKAKIAQQLSLTCEKPRQGKRIFALYQLFSYYFFRSETKSFIAFKIIEISNKLAEKYRENISLINEYIKTTGTSNIADLKNYISYINNKDLVEFREGEEQINFFKQLLYYYDQRQSGKVNISAATTKLNIAALKKIEEEAFECWLRLLDINYELRNTIIGAENRKALYYLSEKYVDLHTIIDGIKKETFKDLEKYRESTVKEYYDIMSYFSLPSNKLLDFRLFVQKKLESRMYEAQFLKLPAGNTINNDIALLNNNCKELKRQYLLSLKEISSIVNHYKEIIIRYQTFFTGEIDKMISYIKESYVNLMNILFKKLHESKTFLSLKPIKFESSDLEVVLQLEKEKIEQEISKLKSKYSSILIPLISSIDSEMERVESKYCFNLSFAKSQCSSLQSLQNETIKAFVSRFKEEKDKVEKNIKQKQKILEDFEKTMLEDTNHLVNQLKEECNTLCSDLLRENQYFWAKFNSEFNSESRKYFVRLYYEYAPFISSWNDGENGWMYEYLILKLNSEYLRKIGSTVKHYSPEGKLHEKAARLIESYSNFFRNVNLQRDEVELDSLLKLNTIPKVDYSKVEEKLNKSLEDLKSAHVECTELISKILNS
ncbi:hypothetical protein MSUIS_06600 [Mycoplasma suis KI3806]|uniref:Uncharacterized protein n=1 Tax=Mycoplasma suis (strain KI_3806) TaxID=708248 RepID=F0V272_MYCS3|nr:hypothetical protein [Mycoplasma suis]CBZ40753.1 hypothetical protein MSUIS_06600 [Mycoplasma suis KI3806]